MTRGLAVLFDERNAVPGAVRLSEPIEAALQTSTRQISDLSSHDIAVASKFAARRNSAALSQGQVDALYAERKALLDKKFFGADFGDVDRRKLALVRWKIDCVIDARHGVHIDRLEEAIRSYERVKQDISLLREELSANRMNARRGSGDGGRRRGK